MGNEAADDFPFQPHGAPISRRRRLGGVAEPYTLRWAASLAYGLWPMAYGLWPMAAARHQSGGSCIPLLCYFLSG
jgi:hypothetical protein